jgi:hypothetical protein
MRKPGSTKLPAVAALLLSSDLRLLVRHDRSHDALVEFAAEFDGLRQPPKGLSAWKPWLLSWLSDKAVAAWQLCSDSSCAAVKSLSIRRLRRPW